MQQQWQDISQIKCQETIELVVLYFMLFQIKFLLDYHLEREEACNEATKLEHFQNHHSKPLKTELALFYHNIHQIMQHLLHKSIKHLIMQVDPRENSFENKIH